MRARILLLILLFLTSACATGIAPHTVEEPVHHLVVLHTNDHHGHPLKFPYGPAEGAGGLPARATLVDQIRRENPHVLLLDAGDLNTGRAESNLFKAKPDLEGYNGLRYDAVAIGNHEFDNPLEILKQQMAYARFPFLCANVLTKEGLPLARPYIVKEFDGFKVAVFGLLLKDTPLITNPGHAQGLVFLDEAQTARALLPMLRQEADLVIGLTHLGIFETSTHGSKRLAREVSGIDVIVDGHSHTRLESPIIVRHPAGHETILVQAWKWGLILGRLDLWIQGGRIKEYRFESIPINLKEVQRDRQGTLIHGPPIVEDPALLDRLKPYGDEAETRLSEVIGFAQAPFSISRARNEETAIGNLVADSMHWFAAKWGADFAVQNGGGIRHDLPAGAISLKSIYDLLPFENSIFLLSLKGDELIRLFDFMGSIPAGSGAFPQFSRGVHSVLDRTARKFTKVLIDGKPIDENKSYRIATNSYLAAGGDGYRIFLEARDRWDTAALQQPVLIDYIKSRGGRLRPALEGRIVTTEFFLESSRPDPEAGLVPFLRPFPAALAGIRRP